jgi:hypothetical protein
MMSKTIAVLIISLGGITAANATPSPICTDLGALGVLLGICPPSHSGPPAQAPEIDPASAMSGLSLLLGGLAVMRGRKKKQ